MSADGDVGPSSWWVGGRSAARTWFVDTLRLLPSTRDYAGLRQTWRADVLAGITVAIVALPLALGFGVTTGMGAEAGLATAVVAGAVAAVFGGSNLQVSGPTGAMAAVLVPIVHRYGVEAVAVVGVMAGLLIVAAALARLGRSVALIPWPVVEGFTIGIAAIIAMQQLPALLGVDRPEVDSTILAAVAALSSAGTSVSPGAVTIGIVVAVVMLVTPRLSRTLPASLIAVAVATVLAEGVLPDIARIGALPAGLPLPVVPDLSLARLGVLGPAALAVALLAGLESLLSARVADGMVDTDRHDPDRELFGQGLANLATPLFGGMPATGAIARTAVNARAGARTRVSALTHALVIGAVILIASDAVGRIPLAALAGVLIVTAARMVDPANVRAVWRATGPDAAIMVVTAAATVVFDLIVAVEVGVALAAFLALRSVARSSKATREVVSEQVDPTLESSLLARHILTYRLDGALFFGAAQRFLVELTAVTDVEVVVLRFPQLDVLDATGAQALGEIIGELEGRGVTVLLKGPRPDHLRTLRAVGALDRLAHEHHLFSTLDAALEHARAHLAGSAGHADASHIPG